MSEQPMDVDLIATAREAQWVPTALSGPGALRAVAPAKVNLFLGVGAPLGDGYHQVTTVLHALALHDVLYLRRTPITSGEVARALEQADGAQAASLAVGGPEGNLLASIEVVDKTGVPYAQDVRLDAESNLAFRALDALARATRYDACERIDMRIEKAIPFEAGLAGGSSDAAAALVAAARWWGVPDAGGELARVASLLGTDVAFFLEGGCALYEGRGSERAHGLRPRKDAVVVVKPPAGVPTGKAYAAFDEAPVPVEPGTLARAQGASDATEVPLANNLWDAACAVAPGLAEAREWLAAQPGVASPEEVLLCGSGGALFALTKGFDGACQVAAAASERGWWARATSLSGLRAAAL